MAMIPNGKIDTRPQLRRLYTEKYTYFCPDGLIEQFPELWKEKNRESIKASCSKIVTALNAGIVGGVLRPHFDDIFRAIRLIPPDDVRLVICGLSPYPSDHADGLAFSSKQITTPKNLDMIKKKIHSELGHQVDLSNDLSRWSQNGVLLLNRSMTLIKTGPLTVIHNDLWLPILQEIISCIGNVDTDRCIGGIFFGAGSQDLMIFADRAWKKRQSIVVLCVHPAVRDSSLWTRQEVFTFVSRFFVKKNETLPSLI